MINSVLSTTDINIVQYIDREAGESEAAISLNPTFTWAKFVLTDDKPNANGQRIPKDEYNNLIKTGIHAPVKMAVGGIAPGHKEALPIGVITNLREVNDKIEGLAALWTREREDDVISLKEMFAGGQLPQLSWEILYEDSSREEDGTEVLKGTSLRATTLVGMPSYEGRTPIYAMAAKETNSEDQHVEELELLKTKVADLESKLAEAESKLSEKDAQIADASVELEQLREYKGAIEKEKEIAERMASIKNKFSEAGIQREDSYFDEKRDTLLSMSAEALDFMIQEMVAFSSVVKEERASKKEELPPLNYCYGEC
jgi:hypothetical protein